jgi:hypothetical protein
MVVRIWNLLTSFQTWHRLQAGEYKWSEVEKVKETITYTVVLQNKQFKQYREVRRSTAQRQRQTNSLNHLNEIIERKTCRLLSVV